MDMELIKKDICFYDTVLDTSAMHEETAELIVPDASPDMVRVICANGNAYVKEKNLSDNKLTIKGIVCGCVLYLAEGDPAVRRLEVNIPFSHEFDLPDAPDKTQCVVTAQLCGIEAREIHSRKLAVRAQIAIEAKCYAPKQMEFCCDVPDDPSCGIEIRRVPVSIYVPVAVKEKSFTITDDLEIPQSNPPFASMLRYDISLSCTDMKIIGNKAIIKGTASIRYAYVTQTNEIAVCEQELPYSQIIDIEDMAEDCDLSVKLCMRTAELEPAHDMTGDTRYLSVNILVDACAVAYFKDEIEVIDDLYSTTHSVDAQFEELPCRALSDHVSHRDAVAENIETACPVKRVLGAHVVLEPARMRDAAVTNDAQVQVLYIGEDDALYCATRRCSAECAVGQPEGARYLCDASVSGVTASGSGNAVTVRFFVDYDVRVLARAAVRNVSALHVEDAAPRSEDEIPSVIIKYVYAEQPLWDIAKTYSTTVDEIVAANGLESAETVAAGNMLLIPRKS